MGENEKKRRGKKIAALKVAGYRDKEISEMANDGYDFDEKVYYVRQGHTKDEIENNFEGLERKHMKEAGLSDAAVEKWQKEGVVDHNL